jgi:hypothetical protein
VNSQRCSLRYPAKTAAVTTPPKTVRRNVSQGVGGGGAVIDSPSSWSPGHPCQSGVFSHTGHRLGVVSHNRRQHPSCYRWDTAGVSAHQFQAVNGALSNRSPCVSERKMARSLALTSVWQLPEVFPRELTEIPELPMGTCRGLKRSVSRIGF